MGNIPTIPVTRARKEHPRCFLTSHRIDDNPCVCMYVYDRLAENGYITDNMNCTQITEEYHKLCKTHPEYRRLLVV
jgi:hypothetical protein